MSTPVTGLTITVSIDSTNPPISGLVRTNDGQDQPFIGWIGLFAALDAALGGGDEPGGVHDERSRLVRWEDPARSRAGRETLNGVAFAQAMASGELPGAPVQALLGSRLVEVSDGEARMELDCGEHLTNWSGTVDGSVLAHLVDATGCLAIGTRAPTGGTATSFDVRTTFVRPIESSAGVISCAATAVHVGGRIATAGAQISDSGGRLCAYGSVLCSISS